MRSDFSLKNVPEEEWPITIQKIPCITVGAEYHGSMYQTVADYHPKNTVHDRGG